MIIDLLRVFCCILKSFVLQTLISIRAEIEQVLLILKEGKFFDKFSRIFLTLS